MNSTQATPPLLDETSAAFIQHYVSINVAARDAQNLPAVARALGCRVSEDRRSVTVFLGPVLAAAVLKNLRDNGAIAMVVSRPSTHETLQLKGTVTNIERISRADHKMMVTYLNSFMEELTGLGYKPDLVRSLDPEVRENCLAVTFEPSSAFVQTPGPRAGQRLEPRT